MSSNPVRGHGAEPPATPTRESVTEVGSRMNGRRLAGRLGSVLLAVVLVGACGVGATQSPSAQPSPSPAANPDEALVADLAAVMSDPYDAAKVAALYAPNAVIHETTADRTQKGLDEIGARIREFNDSNFEAVVTSPVIRQEDYVAAFHKYAGGDRSGFALVVYQLKDGKVLTQWVYPAD